jgi:hypothetical protein
MTERRSPEELLHAILDYENDDPNLRPIEEMSEAERDDELRSRGVDPEAVRARGKARIDALLAKLDAEAAPSILASDRPGVAQARDAAVLTFPKDRDSSRRSVPTVWLWAAAGLAVAAAVAFAVVRGDTVAPSPRAITDDAGILHNEEPDPLKVAAASLRNIARDQCAKQAWTECLGALDEARANDPAGDADPRVQKLRAAAQKGLSESSPSTPDAGKSPKGPTDKAPGGGH